MRNMQEPSPQAWVRVVLDKLEGVVDADLLEQVTCITKRLRVCVCVCVCMCVCVCVTWSVILYKHNVHSESPFPTDLNVQVDNEIIGWILWVLEYCIEEDRPHL